MSSENKMEVDNSPQATEEAMSIGDNDNEASNQDDQNKNKEESDVVILSSAPNTPTPSEAKLKSNKSKSNLSSAEKLKRQELAQKRQEEKVFRFFSFKVSPFKHIELNVLNFDLGEERKGKKAKRRAEDKARRRTETKKRRRG